MKTLVSVQFQGYGETLVISPRTITTIYTRPISYQNVTGACAFFANTLDAALDVSVQVAEDEISTFVDRGAAYTVAANSPVAAIDADDLPKLARSYPWIRLKIVPKTAPTTGTLAVTIHRQF